MFKIKDEAELKRGNIFNSGAELVICTINTVGAMGRGIALSVKKKYPSVFKEYRMRFECGNLKPDEVWVSCLPKNSFDIGMFPTKIKWWEPSPPGLIIHNIEQLKQVILQRGYLKVALPPLGLANGWIRNKEVIKDIILTLNDTFKDMDVEVVLYAPKETVEKIKESLNVS